MRVAPKVVLGGVLEAMTLVEMPQIETRRRASFDSNYLPAWTAEARCRSSEVGGMGEQTPGNASKAAFLDELAIRPSVVPCRGCDDEESHYHWPRSVLAFIEDLCLPCPVRDVCLASAYVEEVHEVERPKESAEDFEGEFYPDLPTAWVEDDRRFGIRGGIPGPVREHLAADPDRLVVAEIWLAALTVVEGWDRVHEEEAAS